MDLSSTITDFKTKIQALTSKRSNDSAAPEPKRSGGGAAAILKPFIHILGKYSFEREKILGVEISPHYIRICQMKTSYGRWSLNQLASTCMETQFTNMDIQLNQDIYADNLKLLLDKHHIKTKDVALSIPTSASIIKIINMPDMEEEDLAGAAAMGAIWESMVQLNGSISEYSVYYKLLRRKVKPSQSLAVADIKSVITTSESGALDNLLGGGDLIGTTAPSSHEPDLSNLLGESPAQITPTEVSLENLLGTASEHAPQASETNLENLLGSSPETAAEATINKNEDGALPPHEITGMVIVEELPEQASTIETIIEEDANTMDVLFIAAKKTDIALYTNIAEKAGLNPIMVDVKANALKHAFDTNPNKYKIPEPYALLEFGADENYIYIIEGSGVATYNITLSAEDKQLMAVHTENNAAIKGFAERYALQLQEILTEYTKSRKSKIYNIYVSSATPLHVEDPSSEPLINNFISHMSELMGTIKMEPCTFCNHIEVPAEFAKKVNAEGNLASWATVVGLATGKLDVFDYDNDNMAINRTNLLPSAQSIRRSRATQVLSTLATAAIFAFVIFLSGASYSMLMVKSSKLSSEIAQLQNVKGDYDQKNKELQKLSIVMGKVTSLDSVKTTLPSNQAQILEIYKNITKSIPEGVWLSDIKYIAPANMEINGNSINDQNILEFVNKLNETGGFKKVSLKTMAVLESKSGDKDKNATSASGASANVKKFTLEGDLMQNGSIVKHEILTGGVK